VMDTKSERKINNVQDLVTSKAFCMKPWVHLHVAHFGEVPLCCNAAWGDEYAMGYIDKQSFDQIWNGQLMRDFRLKMLNDEPNFRCERCYEQEKVGLHSPRIAVNSSYANKLDWALGTDALGFAPQAKPITWDIRITNLCNLKCRMCGHHSSSHWYDDAKALGLEKASQNEAVWHDTKVTHSPKDFNLLMQQLDFVIPDLDEIYFAGGEPLLMDEHYAILHKLIERGKTDVRLYYNTNFSQTTYKGIDVFSLWLNFDRVEVFASLDDSGSRGELQRCGLSWRKVEENRQRMLQICPQVQFVISSTITVFNVQHISDFHRDWVERGFICINEFKPHVLMYPPQYSIRILPMKLKKRAEEKLNAHIEWMIRYAEQHPEALSPKPANLDSLIHEIRGCIKFMNSKDDSHLIPKFREITSRLDNLRSENTRAVFPELEEMWEESFDTNFNP